MWRTVSGNLTISGSIHGIVKTIVETDKQDENTTFPIWDESRVEFFAEVFHVRDQLSSSFTTTKREYSVYTPAINATTLTLDRLSMSTPNGTQSNNNARGRAEGSRPNQQNPARAAPSNGSSSRNIQTVPHHPRAGASQNPQIAPRRFLLTG
jgi:hypothetical protein